MNLNLLRSIKLKISFNFFSAREGENILIGIFSVWVDLSIENPRYNYVLGSHLGDASLFFSTCNILFEIAVKETSQ